MHELWPDRVAVDEERLRALYAFPATPWLRTNFVATLDGSSQGPDGRSGSINTPTDHHVFALQRALCDVVVVGAGTARAEAYRGIRLDENQHAARRAAGLTGVPALAVVSRSLAVDRHLTDGDGPVLVIAGASGDDAALTRAGVEVVRAPGPGGVDLRRAMHQLTERGLTRVLCEGGPTLHHQLLAEGLVDELTLTLVPQIVSGLGPRITDGAGVAAGFELGHLLLDDDGTVFGRWVHTAP